MPRLRLAMEPGVPGFEMVKKLGGGSVAEVFLVRSALTKQQQVMKVLRPELMSDAAVVGRFLDEAKLCEALDHPHIVKHLGVSRTPAGGLYILTRYLEGVDLARHLKDNGPLSAAEWVELGLKLCDALSYIHERGIVHRDLKPSNVFLAGGLAAQRPVLIDFGVARPEGPRRVKTEMGVVLTTPEYAAPELVQGGAPDIRSDLYAFGVLMFESLVGHPPFVDANANRIFQMHLDESPGPLPTGAAALEPVVQRCMAKKPEDRYQNAKEIAEALKEAVPFLSHARETLLPQVSDTEERPARPEPPSIDVGPGTVLGSYKVVRLLGEGGMGQVFLATHEKLGRHVAIKLLRPELATRTDTVDRFFHEARSVNQINHEHIVDVHDFVDERATGQGGRVYCIMELLAGKTLRDLIKEGPVPLRRNLGIARQVCDALSAAHRLNIVHRDVKPENIFLTERSGIQDFVKVLDFGMAKFQQQEGSVNKATLQGMIVGTPDYMAPEQANALPTDARTDIYAVGVLLYEMITGDVPFTDKAMMPLLLKISNEAPPPLPAIDRAGEPIPETLRALVMWCLEKSPASRPQELSEVIQVLDQILSPPRGSAERPLRPVRSPIRKWVAAGAGLGAGIIVVVAVAASHKSAPPEDATPAPAPIAVAPAPPPVAPKPAPAPPQPPAIKLSVNSKPEGAVVRRLDSNQALGKTPLRLAAVPARTGDVALRLELPGYSPTEHKVRWDRDVNLDVTLAPDHAGSVVAKPRPPSPNSRRSSKDDLVDPLSP